MLTVVFLQMQAVSREQEESQVKSIHHTPPYTTIHHAHCSVPSDAGCIARASRFSSEATSAYTTVHHHARAHCIVLSGAG